MKWYETSPTVWHSTWTPIAEGMATRGQQATCCPRWPPLPPAQSHPLHLLDDACGMANCKWHKVQTQFSMCFFKCFFSCFFCLWRRHRQILHRTICIKKIWTSSPGMLPTCRVDLYPSCLVLGDDQRSHHSTRAAISTNCQCSCLLHEPQGFMVSATKMKRWKTALEFRVASSSSSISTRVDECWWPCGRTIRATQGTRLLTYLGGENNDSSCEKSNSKLWCPNGALLISTSPASATCPTLSLSISFKHQTNSGWRCALPRAYQLPGR